MHTTLVQRQYDEVIAQHYDRDPQGVLGGSRERALAQIRTRLHSEANGRPLKILDVGMGTGRFLERLMVETGRPIEPFGLDLSEKMVDVARTRLPNLAAVVDDAQHLDNHFPGEAFDLISTHFVTGFVPAGVLAPKIWNKLAPGGCWSLVGGTKQGFPALQRKANGRIIRWIFGGRKLDLDELVCNPADLNEATQTVEEHGFVVQSSETFEPALQFRNLNEFLDFAYYGGWLAPFVEELGLHEARMLLRLVLNTFVFPVKDNHSIVVVLAQKAQRR